MLKGDGGGRYGCEARGGKDGFELAGADDGVYFRDAFLNFVAIALDEATGDDELASAARGLVASHFEDGVSMDSCLAVSMKLQVLTTRISASSGWEVRRAPARSSKPIMTSESTRFLGQPRETNPTEGAEGGEDRVTDLLYRAGEWLSV